MKLIDMNKGFYFTMKEVDVKTTVL